MVNNFKILLEKMMKTGPYFTLVINPTKQEWNELWSGSLEYHRRNSLDPTFLRWLVTEDRDVYVWFGDYLHIDVILDNNLHDVPVKGYINGEHPKKVNIRSRGKQTYVGDLKKLLKKLNVRISRESVAGEI